MRAAGLPEIKEGMRVGYRMGRHVLPALVLEDRGPLASGGRHVWRIALKPDDPEQRDEFEVSEESLEPLPDAA